MDERFNYIVKLWLRNSEHFQLMTELKFSVSTRTAYMPAPVVATFNQSFLPAYNTLDDGIKKIRKSPFTEEIQAADRERDDAYLGMLDAVNSALRHFNPALSGPARKVKILFDAYGNVAAKSLYAETAEITNFLQDLRGPSYAEDAEALGLLDWAARLENRNMAVANLLRQRGNEMAGKPDVDVKAARAAIDAVYDRLVVLIEAFIVLGIGNAEHLAAARELVSTFNQTIDSLNRLIARRRRKQGGGAAEEDEEEEGGEQEGAEGGEGQGEE